MPTVEESVFIARSPQEVYDFLTDAPNLPVWDSSILEAEQVDPGPVDVGTHFKGTSKILGRRFEWTTEVTGARPPSSFESRSVDGAMTFEVANTLEAEGDGTRLTYRVDAASGLGGVFGKLADPIVEKAHRRTVRANLDTLAELLEQRAT